MSHIQVINYRGLDIPIYRNFGKKTGTALLTRWDDHTQGALSKFSQLSFDNKLNVSMAGPMISKPEGVIGGLFQSDVIPMEFIKRFVDLAIDTNVLIGLANLERFDDYGITKLGELALEKVDNLYHMSKELIIISKPGYRLSAPDEVINLYWRNVNQQTVMVTTPLEPISDELTAKWLLSDDIAVVNRIPQYSPPEFSGILVDAI